jgi:hypothetical protein
MSEVQFGTLRDFISGTDELAPLSEACADGYCGDCLEDSCQCVCHDDGPLPEDFREWDRLQEERLDSEIRFHQFMGDGRWVPPLTGGQ